MSRSIHSSPCRIVITGGPCAGKTKIFDSLTEDLGNRATFIPEVARSLLKRGFPIPNREPGCQWSECWQYSFQAAVLPIQELLEEKFMRIAIEGGHELVICDRGIMDGASFLKGGKGEFCRRYRVVAEEMAERYQGVIHVESLACPSDVEPQEYYMCDDERTEPEEKARLYDARIAEAWNFHPHYHFVKVTRTIGEKVAAVRSIIASMTPTTDKGSNDTARFLNS